MRFHPGNIRIHGASPESEWGLPKRTLIQDVGLACRPVAWLWGQKQTQRLKMNDGGDLKMVMT